MKYLKTSDIARAVGLHPNTIRIYEEWGFLSPIPDEEIHYHCFSDKWISTLSDAELYSKEAARHLEIMIEKYTESFTEST